MVERGTSGFSCVWTDDVLYREAFRGYDDRHGQSQFVQTSTREHLRSDREDEGDSVEQVTLESLEDDAPAGVESPGRPTARGRREPRRDAEPALALGARIDPGYVELPAGVTAMATAPVRAARGVVVPERRVQYDGFGWRRDPPRPCRRLVVSGPDAPDKLPATPGFAAILSVSSVYR